MKNTKRNSERSPYSSASFEKITAPAPEKSKVSGKSTIKCEDMRVKGGK
jgi:hypothetical protein